jgi:hypothetical protein
MFLCAVEVSRVTNQHHWSALVNQSVGKLASPGRSMDFAAGLFDGNPEGRYLKEKIDFF